MIQVPEQWLFFGVDRIRYLMHIWWYFRGYDFTPSNDVTIAWMELSGLIPTLRRYRKLAIFVVVPQMKLRWPYTFGDVIDVEHKLFDSVSSPGAEHSGFDFDVQAMFLVQKTCVDICMDAISIIEKHPPERKSVFTFTCERGVKSVACAVLLASLVYPHAKIAFFADVGSALSR